MIDWRGGAGGSGARRSTRRGGPDRRRAIRSAAAGVALAASLTVSAAPPVSGAPSVGGLRPPSVTSEFDVHIDAAAALHGVSRELVRAIIEAESGFDRRAVWTAGAAGLMQLMPAAARRFGVADSLDARQNIFGGTRYLRVNVGAVGRLPWTEPAPCSPLTLLAGPCAPRPPNARLYRVETTFTHCTPRAGRSAALLAAGRYAVAPPITALAP